MKADIDRSGCIGCGMCENICPEVFQLDDEQISTVIVEPIPEDLIDQAKTARDSCPVSVISLTE